MAAKRKSDKLRVGEARENMLEEARRTYTRDSTRAEQYDLPADRMLYRHIAKQNLAKNTARAYTEARDYEASLKANKAFADSVAERLSATSRKRRKK